MLPEFKRNNFFGDLFSFVSSKVKSEVKYRSLSKQEFIDTINDNINNHNTFLSPISGLLDSDLTDLFRNIQKTSGIKQYPYFIDFRKGLIKIAAQLESDTPFNSIIKTNKIFVEINKKLLSNIDKIVSSDKITIFDMKLSVYGLMSFLKRSEIYGNISQYLLYICMTLRNEKTSDIPKYRIKYIKDYLELCIETTNSFCNSAYKYDIIKDIEIVKKKGIDFKVAPLDKSISLDAIAKPSDYSTMMLSNLILIPTFFNIFKLVGENWIQYKNTKREKIKDTKEWLESHVALLKYEAATKEQNSSDQIRLEKIIGKYDDMITKYDKKLNDYVEES